MWRFRGEPVAYERAGTDGPPILLLPGFGVGSYHFDAQLRRAGAHAVAGAPPGVTAAPQLHAPLTLPAGPAPGGRSALGATHRVYALDYLGQAASWPERPDGVAFSACLWRDQVAAFIEEVLGGEPAWLVGNSLGGYLAAYVGATRPRLVRGVALLNAAPFWGSVPRAVRRPSLASSGERRPTRAPRPAG